MLGRIATLDDIADFDLDRLAELGFDWVWLLSVWQTGPAARAISRSNPQWRHEFAETLPDLRDEDIAGSGFAIRGYTVSTDLGGAPALAGFRQRLQERGMKLMLDFVPNHMAPDHPWIDDHPEQVPGFCFMAEVYWDLEWALQQQGFDYTYDKRLYDRLREGHARPVREHFHADLDFQDKSARFLENHDEPRAAATFSHEVHEAAAVITFLSQGLRFFHQRQFQGRRKRISSHLVRAPEEPVDSRLAQFYDRLLTVLRQPILREGCWQLLECTPAWDGNWTSDCFLAFAWTGKEGEKRLVVVNYSEHQSQCYVPMPWGELAGQMWKLHDQMGAALFERNGNELATQGLYVDVPAWGYYVFDIRKIKWTARKDV